MISAAVAAMGNGPLTEAGLQRHVAPLFSQSLAGDRARGEIYLANHSLGRPPDRVAEDVRTGLEMWFGRMDGCWEERGWLDEIDSFRTAVAQLIGFSRPDSVVAKTSAGQGLRAVLNALIGPKRLTVVTTRGEFDSVDFILKTYATKGLIEVRWVEPTVDASGVPTFDANTICDAIEVGADVVVLSQVFFGTAQILDGVDRIVEATHRVGGLVVIDAYHAAGVIPLELERIGADFVIGGCYKYLRGGPGACWLAIHPRHLDSRVLRTLDTGWFAKRDTFRYERPDEPILARGGDAWLESTPPVLTAYQAKSGLEITLALGVKRLRDYSLHQQARMREAFARAGRPLLETARPELAGAFSLLPAPDAPTLAAALKKAGVNSDARGGFVRLCPDVLNTEAELTDAARIVSGTVG